ncbi:MAG: methyltransferase domain-containing protein [Spirochaetes bacterium]|nr:methyltransferase domain-containing protein [Spirochaetota bacterium]
MAHRFNPEHFTRLDNPERRRTLPPEEILRLAGLRAGDRMIDIGAGSGYFAIPAAGIAGDGGSVTAVDVSEAMLTILRERVESAGVRNVDIVLSTEYGLDVPSESHDLALLCTVLHEVDDRERFLREARRVLRPGGRIAVVEWRREPMEAGPPLEHRIGVDETMAAMERSDFSAVRAVNFNERFYIVLGERGRGKG